MAKDLSPVFADDPVADAQAKACTFTHLLGGKKRIEDFFRIGNSWSIVAKPDFHQAAAAAAGNFDSSGPRRLANRVIGVVKDRQQAGGWKRGKCQERYSLS